MKKILASLLTAYVLTNGQTPPPQNTGAATAPGTSSAAVTTQTPLTSPQTSALSTAASSTAMSSTAMSTTAMSTTAMSTTRMTTTRGSTTTRLSTTPLSTTTAVPLSTTAVGLPGAIPPATPGAPGAIPPATPGAPGAPVAPVPPGAIPPFPPMPPIATPITPPFPPIAPVTTAGAAPITTAAAVPAPPAIPVIPPNVPQTTSAAAPPAPPAIPVIPPVIPQTTGAAVPPGVPPAAPAPPAAAPAPPAPPVNPFCPAASVPNRFGPGNQGCSSNVGPASIATDVGGQLSCENYGCCQCSEISCGANGIPCDTAYFGDSGAVGAQNINIIGSLMPTMGSGGPQIGAEIDCGGVEGCKAAKITGKGIRSMDCTGDLGCAQANIVINDPAPGMQLGCDGFMGCADATIAVNIGVAPPAGQACSPSYVPRIIELGAFQFGGQAAAQNADITINNLGCDMVMIENLDCGAGPDVCAGTKLTFNGNIQIQQCDLYGAAQLPPGCLSGAGGQQLPQFPQFPPFPQMPPQGPGFSPFPIPQPQPQPFPVPPFQQPFPPMQPQPVPPFQPQPVPPTNPQPFPPMQPQPVPPTVPATPVTTAAAQPPPPPPGLPAVPATTGAATPPQPPAPGTTSATPVTPVTPATPVAPAPAVPAPAPAPAVPAPAPAAPVQQIVPNYPLYCMDAFSCSNKRMKVTNPSPMWELRCEIPGSCAGLELTIDFTPGYFTDRIEGLIFGAANAAMGATININSPYYIELGNVECAEYGSCNGLNIVAGQGVDLYNSGIDCAPGGCFGCTVTQNTMSTSCEYFSNTGGGFGFPQQQQGPIPMFPQMPPQGPPQGAPQQPGFPQMPAPQQPLFPQMPPQGQGQYPPMHNYPQPVWGNPFI